MSIIKTIAGSYFYAMISMQKLQTLKITGHSDIPHQNNRKVKYYIIAEYS